MKKVKIGVVGVGRGSSMIGFCGRYQNAELVAICDKWEEGLQRKKEEINDPAIAYYTDYDEFLKHDMDAVVLANYANEHAPFAIKAMESGKHVLSEVLPVHCLAEAVQLVECVEKTGKIYAYAENYCYMPALLEMKKQYEAGALGEFEYGEGEYIHNCEPIWPHIAYGDKHHWRNREFTNFYCTHSLGPLLHITGLRPVKVTGFEIPHNDRMERMGKLSGATGIEMVTLENGAIVKSIHGDLYKNSVWYTIYGSKGRMESAREDAKMGDTERVYSSIDSFAGAYDGEVTTYEPTSSDEAAKYGHNGSDFYTMWNFVEKIRGNQATDIIDVYEALDMYLPGLLGFFSILQGGASLEIPNFREKAVREQYRNDRRCTDPKVAGDQLIPCSGTGDHEIPDTVYERQRKIWEGVR